MKHVQFTKVIWSPQRFYVKGLDAVYNFTDVSLVPVDESQAGRIMQYDVLVNSSGEMICRISVPESDRSIFQEFEQALEAANRRECMPSLA